MEMHSIIKDCIKDCTDERAFALTDIIMHQLGSTPNLTVSKIREIIETEITVNMRIGNGQGRFH